MSIASRILLGGCTALVTIGALAGCSQTTEKDAPATSTTTTPSSSSAPAVSPTEKAISPTDGNSFSPSVNPTGPGAVCKDIVNGVCVR
jgi:hypothetical protein